MKQLKNKLMNARRQFKQYLFVYDYVTDVV